MKDILRKIIPRKVINYLWHLPRAVFANIKEGFPSRNMIVIGITGTDGKTTTVNMLYEILKNAGEKVSMVSTINAEIGGEKIETGFHVTSPDPFFMQKLLKRSARSGYKIVVIEATSHALDQFRYWGIRFEVAIVTNISHEHLDYHKTLKNYFLAKAKLVKNSRYAVLNCDDPSFYQLSKIASGKVLSFGLSKKADVNPLTFPLKLSVYGRFNLYNALAAACAAKAMGVDSKKIKTSLEKFKEPPGRMQSVPNKKGLKIIIDFAHTPNGLENALTALKNENTGNLIAVFGCAGERDEGKRNLMGEIAGKLADNIIITAEDPRGQIEEINSQILKGIRKSGKKADKFFVENNREKAIKLAINTLAKKGDVVGIFGKGHEKSMNLDGLHEIPWSDFKAVNLALKNGK